MLSKRFNTPIGRRIYLNMAFCILLFCFDEKFPARLAKTRVSRPTLHQLSHGANCMGLAASLIQVHEIFFISLRMVLKLKHSPSLKTSVKSSRKYFVHFKLNKTRYQSYRLDEIVPVLTEALAAWHNMNKSPLTIVISYK